MTEKTDQEKNEDAFTYTGEGEWIDLSDAGDVKGPWEWLLMAGPFLGILCALLFFFFTRSA